MALLHLYTEKGDTILMRKKAKEIVQMPVKIESEQVTTIKNYATKLYYKNTL